MPADEGGEDDEGDGGRSGEGDGGRSSGGDGDPSDGADGDPSDGADGDPMAEANRAESRRDEPCPECAEPLPTDARFCPHCSTAIDADGEAVDLSELDGDLLPEDPAELLLENDRGARRAAGSVRVLAGLAVSIPIAPLVLFLTGAFVSLSIWSAGLVFFAGWLLPAALLSRARVPAEAFGRSLYLVGVCTLLVPIAVRSDGLSAGSGGSALSFDVVALVSFVIAGVAIALGTFVTRQARKRVSGERRGFEELRED